MNQFPPGPWVSHEDSFKFFRKNLKHPQWNAQRGPGDTDSWKKPEVEILCQTPFKHRRDQQSFYLGWRWPTLWQRPPELSWCWPLAETRGRKLLFPSFSSGGRFSWEIGGCFAWELFPQRKTELNWASGLLSSCRYNIGVGPCVFVCECGLYWDRGGGSPLATVLTIGFRLSLHFVSHSSGAQKAC